MYSFYSWVILHVHMSLLFNMLSRLVITFLPRSKHRLISWVQSSSAVILEPPKVNSATVSTVSPSICHEVMGPDAMILSGSWRSFLYSSSVYAWYLFLISSASIRSIPFLSFIETIFAWSVPLVSPVFVKRSLVLPILLFSSISLHWSLSKAFLSLLAIWNSAFKWLYLSFSTLPFTSHLFTAISKACSDSHFSFLHFFFGGMVVIPVSCTMSRTSIHSSSGPLSIKSIPWKLFLTSTVYS